ncbi:hypothetical protein BY996DRAFT_4632465 [Phakopsora pachyrhizi]|uniref:DUF7727 domain-containing protein n=1 Tax=Phakopsora pachyrhizi TaxID=170000 RepID=A0AAV0BDB5_PHAPC|nr:hypothetical protein BY996DRAFT_4632465 [Phakopsora pachyrhizi]CAH7684796.1 hypothetical protein PPACK8108_LOCUS19222 [Phakopsora pachyrhizi]
MGKLIWSQWGRLLAITSGFWTAWGGLWGIFYRKYFWDFVEGKLGPAGIIPGPSAAPFLAVIVDLPLVQGLCILTGLLTVAFEWPLFPNLFVYQSLVFKVIFYVHAGILSALIYQSVDAAVFYFITILAYTVAISKGETVRGKGAGSDQV